MARGVQSRVVLLIPDRLAGLDLYSHYAIVQLG
jgi:hypothetical protein